MLNEMIDMYGYNLKHMVLCIYCCTVITEG